MAEVVEKSRIAIVGGGLVGALAASFFAKRGHRVAIYEYRSDIRLEKSSGQSINLALSFRGREALKAIGLENVLVKHGTSMRGRMLHDKDGNLKEVLYDSVKGNCIYSINRRFLNMVLLDVNILSPSKSKKYEIECKIYQLKKAHLPLCYSITLLREARKIFPRIVLLVAPVYHNVDLSRAISAAEKYPEVQLNFNRKLMDADLENGKMQFLNTNTGITEEAEADLIIGADGAHSKIRNIMTKQPLFSCSQTHVDHAYVEISVPRREDNEFAMSGNNLHIWPRGEFMMSSLPNEDRTFTGNLFAPFHVFEKLKTPEALLSFYTEHFPDFLQLIGEESLLKQFFEKKPQTLISVKCKPYHVGKTIIVGDAAHAMVPFYAQGMNTGFEDILVLDEIMERYDSDFAKILPKYSELRYDNGHAICDLAMYNYLEMRDLVARKSFLFRKLLDNILFTLIPNYWVPLYFTVQFTRMSFRECVTNKEWQDKVLKIGVLCLGFLIFAVLVGFFLQNAM